MTIGQQLEIVYNSIIELRNNIFEEFHIYDLYNALEKILQTL